MIENNDKFTWHSGEVSIFDKDGTDITSSSYEERKKANTTFLDEIHIGDIIITKGTGRIVVIKYIDYNINNSLHADYAGVLYNSDSDDLILLGSDDIDTRIFDSSKVSNKHK